METPLSHDRDIIYSVQVFLAWIEFMRCCAMCKLWQHVALTTKPRREPYTHRGNDFQLATFLQSPMRRHITQFLAPVYRSPFAAYEMMWYRLPHLRMLTLELVDVEERLRLPPCLEHLEFRVHVRTAAIEALERMIKVASRCLDLVRLDLYVNVLGTDQILRYEAGDAIWAPLVALQSLAWIRLPPSLPLSIYSLASVGRTLQRIPTIKTMYMSDDNDTPECMLALGPIRLRNLNQSVVITPKWTPAVIAHGATLEVLHPYRFEDASCLRQCPQLTELVLETRTIQADELVPILSTLVRLTQLTMVVPTFTDAHLMALFPHLLHLTNLALQLNPSIHSLAWLPKQLRTLRMGSRSRIIMPDDECKRIILLSELRHLTLDGVCSQDIRTQFIEFKLLYWPRIQTCDVWVVV